MTSQYPNIHPDLQQIAKKTPKVNYGKWNVGLFKFLIGMMPSPKELEGVRVENTLIPRSDGRTNIRLRIYQPRSVPSPTPVLLWIHGGGYLIGRPEQDDVSCAYFVRELGLTVLSVDYRLAPKYPFPAALDDCYSALQWVISHSGQLGIDPKRIAIGGASAGGGLAAALVQMAHDRQEIKPVFQLLVHPMLDDRTVLRTDIDDSQNITWNNKSNRFGWESYLGKKCAVENLPVYSVPARRADLSGLPPTWIGVGALDIFHDEDVVYTQRLRECGVECEIDIVPGAFHGFDVFDPDIPIVQDFRASQAAALKKYLFEEF